MSEVIPIYLCVTAYRLSFAFDRQPRPLHIPVSEFLRRLVPAEGQIRHTQRSQLRRRAGM